MSFWDERFSSEEFVYGKEPNQFYKHILDLLNPGSILLPGEGEGRNALYAAKTGWKVTAFDSSTAGKEKAHQLFNENNLELNYQISDYKSFESTEKYDVISLIFTHLPSNERKIAHSKYIDLLKDGGTLILQMFSKEQLGLTSGGPKDLDMLVSAEELRSDFEHLTSLSVEQETILLNEGPYHQGEAHVISVKGIK